jgi:hypothetical protein
VIDQAGRALIAQRNGLAAAPAATLYQPGWVNTPTDIRAGAEQTNAYIEALNAGISRSGAPKTFRDGWNQFYGGWKAWYADASQHTLRKWLTSDVQSQLVSYQQQAGEWAQQAAKYRVKAPGPGPEAATGGAQKVMMWIGIGVVGLVVLGVVAKLVHTVMLGNVALGEAEAAALAIADAKRRKKHDRSTFSIT